jgi:hypothetical protein
MGAVWTQLLSEGGYFDFWASWSLVALVCGILGAYIALPPVVESILQKCKSSGINTKHAEQQMEKSKLLGTASDEASKAKRFNKWVGRFSKGYGDAALFADVPGSVSCDGMGSCRAVHPRALC